MKLHTTKQRFEQAGIESSGEYKVQVGSKLFKVLTDNLYPDKIYAVIRELSTNAYESHQENGNPEQPFLVKLPSSLNTVFSIRDYGIGLSQESVERVYTELFNSTKEDSNEQGGAYGLGSKSPFCYVKSFIVHSYYNGYKYVYFMIINSNGVPTYSLASKTETTEVNGLEVVLDVKQEHISNFVRTAERVYKWFKVKPKVIGNSSYVQPKSIVNEVSGTKWAIAPNSDVRGAVAVMANVAYSLSSYTGPDKNMINTNNLILHFDIGEIEPEPSREGLSFDPQTIKAIASRLSVIKSEMKDRVESEIASCASYFDACAKYFSIQKYFDIPSVSYKGKRIVQILDFGNVQIDGKNRLIEYPTFYSYRRSVYYTNNINTSRKHLFVVNDLKRGASARIINHLKMDGKYSSALLCENTPDDISKFCSIVMIEPNQLVMASSLPVPTRASSSRASHKTKAMLLCSEDARSTYCWKDTDIDVDNGEGYYVNIYNNMVKLGTVTVHPKSIYAIVKHIDPTITVYGIRTSFKGKFGPKWKLLSEELEKLLFEFYNSNKEFMSTFESCNSRIPANFINNIEAIKDNIDNPKTKERFISLLSNIKYATSKKAAAQYKNCMFILNFLNKNFHKDIKVLKNTLVFNEMKYLMDTYPLLSSYVEHPKELVYYVNYISNYGR